MMKSPIHHKAIAHMHEEEISTSNPNVERNTVCFIYHLPIDILQSIFISCASAYHSREHNGRPIPVPPSWVNVSYVSRHWRGVALNCPTLWTYLFTLSPCWTAELLARSKQAPLKIYVDLKRRDGNSRGYLFVEQVMEHAERIQEFHLEIFGTDSRARSLLSKLSSAAPLLRRLCISLTSCPKNWSLLPFNGDTPSVSTLMLRNCPTPWYMLKWGDLTTLHLESIPIQFQQSFSDFLATLRRMQNLQSLQIMGAVASAIGFLSSAALRSIQKIDLPHLSKLRLCAPLSTVIALLSCISIAKTPQVRLQPYIDPDFPPSPDHFPLLSSLLSEIYCKSQDPASSIPPIRALSIGCWAGRRMKLTFSASERDCDRFIGFFNVDEWDLNAPLQVLFSADISITREERNYMMCRICCSMPLSNIHSVHVVDPPSDPSMSAFWSNILQHLPDLRHLKLSHGTLPQLAPILSVTTDVSAENHNGQFEEGRSRTLVPALAVLELIRLRLVNGLLSAEGSIAIPFDAQSLLCALAPRKLQAQSRLRMSQCLDYQSNGEIKRVDLTATWGNGSWEMLSYEDEPESRDG